ncbi:MAG: class I lanthipeptide [Hyphomicrobiales bacterium]
MKKKNLKLNLSKQTIANLDISEMTVFNGGRLDTRWHDCDSIPTKCIEVPCYLSKDVPCETDITKENTCFCLNF